MPRESQTGESDERDAFETSETDKTPITSIDLPHKHSQTKLCGEKLVLGYQSTEEPVIEGESIEVPQGSVTALVGPNGSGKSTLLKALANQLSPEKGEVLIDGLDITSFDSKKLARKIGHLSQESTSPDTISVEDLVYHGRYPHRGFFEMVSEEDEKAVEHAIELAGIEHLRNREVGSLSGGQKQLVWVAMVLAQDTDILLLDEPTTFLDLRHQLQIMEIIETLRDESDITVVLVLHDIEQAARYADYLVALQDGEIVDRGRPREVVTEDLLSEVFGIESEVQKTRTEIRITPISPIEGHTH